MLAGGIDNIYPPEHDKLYAAIAEQGCLVSEQPPGFKPRGQDFPRRNRIIAGIALGVLVVEAARRSGSLTTGRFAGEQGREVFAIPGHPLDPRAEGTNKLLKEGATLVTEPGDILAALNFQMPGETRRDAFAQDAAPSQPAARAALLSLSDEDRDLVLSALGPQPIDVDEIARHTKLSTRCVQVALLELDLAGRIERQGQGLIALRTE